jgi:hypothetical protein
MQIYCKHLLITIFPSELTVTLFEQNQEWRRKLSSAIDAFREMLRREKLMSNEIMKMNSMEKMADLCPTCYGPYMPGKQDDEPDFIVCMDGNFQHRQHLQASVETS